MLTIAACSSGGDSSIVATVDATSVTTTSVPVLTASGRERAVVGSPDDERPTPEPPSATSPPTTTVVPTTIDPGPTTTGRLAVNPGGTPPTAPTDPYVGTLGRLSIDEQLAVPVVDPPPEAVTGVSPLTGLAADPTVLDRPALVVKIDNAPAARPQSGLAEADVVFEELVEGGTTRFAAVLHSRDADVVGPVRSFRSTDIGIVLRFGRPAFAWSGANAVFAGLLADTPVIDRGSAVAAGYWRSTGRRAPHNLYSSSAALWSGLSGGAPSTTFVFRTLDDPVIGESVDEIVVDFGRTVVRWAWDGSAFARQHATTVHRSAGGPVTADNVIVQLTEYVPTGLGDSSGAPVLEGVDVGTGRAVVLTDGRRIEATWTRPSLGDVTTYTDASGAHIPLTPGTTWILLAPPGSID